MNKIERIILNEVTNFFIHLNTIKVHKLFCVTMTPHSFNVRICQCLYHCDLINGQLRFSTINDSRSSTHIPDQYCIDLSDPNFDVDNEDYLYKMVTDFYRHSLNIQIEKFKSIIEECVQAMKSLENI